MNEKWPQESHGGREYLVNLFTRIQVASAEYPSHSRYLSFNWFDKTWTESIIQTVIYARDDARQTLML